MNKKIDPKKRRADIRLQIATVSQQLISNSEQKVARLGNLVKFCQDKDITQLRYKGEVMRINNLHFNKLVSFIMTSVIR